jgi:hypothetical protein
VWGEAAPAEAQAEGHPGAATQSLATAFRRYKALAAQYDEASWGVLEPEEQARLVAEARGAARQAQTAEMSAPSHTPSLDPTEVPTPSSSLDQTAGNARTQSTAEEGGSKEAGLPMFDGVLGRFVLIVDKAKILSPVRASEPSGRASEYIGTKYGSSVCCVCLGEGRQCPCGQPINSTGVARAAASSTSATTPAPQRSSLGSSKCSVRRTLRRAGRRRTWPSMLICTGASRPAPRACIPTMPATDPALARRAQHFMFDMSAFRYRKAISNIKCLGNQRLAERMAETSVFAE